MTRCEPFVSICCITYNHEQYIKDTIEGFLMQETDFPFEIILGEDESQDRTRDTCIEYAERYPDKIRLFLRSRRDVIYVNGHPTGRFNLIESLKVARGKYIALCEGDDYWTDSHKLQKQVEFLEAHPECSFCFHDVMVVHEDGSRPSYRFGPPEQKPFFRLQDVLRSTLTQTCSLMFRNGLLPELPDWFYQAPIGDWALTVLLAERGKIGYFGDVMGVYRNHAGGVWAGIEPREQIQQRIKMYDLFNAHFAGRYAALLDPSITACHYALALSSHLAGQPGEEAHWMSLVVEKFPAGAETLQQKALDSLLASEGTHGPAAAEEALHWTCARLQIKPGGAQWSKDLRREWHAARAYQAYQRGDQAALRLSSRQALWNDWRLLKNRGFVSRWLSAMIGGRSLNLLRGR